MPRNQYLYRRISGIYAVRICVPKRLQAYMGRKEIHISTGIRDAAAAKISALRLLLEWHQRILDLENMDILNVVEGHPLLAGDGLISIKDAAQAFGLDSKTLLTEVVNSRGDLICVADCWRGIEVADLGEVDRDYDGSFILNEVESLGQPVVVSGSLVLYDSRVATSAFHASGEYEAEIFFRDEKHRRAVFIIPGEKVGISSLLLRKRDAEIVRLRLSAGVTSHMVEVAKSAHLPAATAPSPFTPPLAPPPVLHKYGGLRASELVERFLEAKKRDWKNDQYKRMDGVCNVFAELMEDPSLAEIDRPVIIQYRSRLQTLPANLYQARRRHGVESLSDLITATEKFGEARMSLDTANDYIRKLSEMFNWAVTEELMPRNPAHKVGDVGKRKRREQDERCVFDKADLDNIFGAEWFANGEGKKSKRGVYTSFQPHYYWLPLLGLYSGGRLNELAQLYLGDVQQTEDGYWFLDFNLDGANKIAVDPKDETLLGLDKSLKTVNSQRVVALHEVIVSLGLPEYVKALAEAGHERLFPELAFDKVKGYGKAAGSWFNERYLGEKLKIVRDGTKTFHSFRHMFVTGLFDAEVPETTVAQLAGHERGETMSGRRYRKDQEAAKLKPYIDLLDFNLPTIMAFNVAAGIQAVESALDRKRRHPSARGRGAVPPRI